MRDRVPNQRRLSWRRGINIVASVVTPLALQAVLVVVDRESALKPFATLGLGTYALEILVGFSFLVYEFRWAALILAPFYMVLMALALVGISLDVVGTLYGDWL